MVKYIEVGGSPVFVTLQVVLTVDMWNCSHIQLTLSVCDILDYSGYSVELIGGTTRITFVFVLDKQIFYIYTYT